MTASVDAILDGLAHEVLACGRPPEEVSCVDYVRQAMRAATYALRVSAPGTTPEMLAVAAPNFLPPQATSFERGLAAGMAWLRARQLQAPKGETP